MVFYGIVFAILENDIRRILSFSIINQVGFMITAIGIGSELAIAGAAAHAFCHIIYKSLLMMNAGSVIYVTGKRKCSELGGIYNLMPITTICSIIAALSISAFPLTSGFVSKSLIVAASENEQLFWVWILLVAASAGVFFHAGIKFPWFVFIQKNKNHIDAHDPPMLMRLSMVILAVLCILPGIWPKAIYDLLPNKIDFLPYSASHIISQLQLLTASAIAFFVCLPLLKRTETVSLTFDWMYRKVGYTALRCINNLSSKNLSLKLPAFSLKNFNMAVFDLNNSIIITLLLLVTLLILC
jgi:multicomponent Na+:H+ antiporter subunit D